MAKQNVTYIERHLEKFIIATAGVLLALVVYWFGIFTPNVAQVDGTAMGPDQFYAGLKQKADSYREGMKRATPKDEENEVAIPDVEKMRSPYAAANLPAEIHAPYAALRQSVPAMSIEKGMEKRALVRILPPSRPVLESNRAVARLPEPLTIRLQDYATASLTDKNAPEKDCAWVAIWAALNRKAQRELFAKANYDFERQSLVVLEVQAERRELLDDGQWGQPQPVKAFRETTIEYPEKVTLELGEDGQLVPTAEDAKLLGDLRAKAEAVQDEILHGRFAEFLDRASLWSMPERLPEVDLDLNEFFHVTDESGALPARPAPRAGEGTAAAALIYGRDQLKKAKELAAQNKPLDADVILDALIQDQDIPKSIRDDAQKQRDEIKTAVDEAREAQERRSRVRQANLDAKLGAEIEPMWLIDPHIKPGHTYSYRLRVLAMNPYAGVPKQLQDPEEAGKVVLTGDWSSWSDPITTRPTRALFVTAVREGDRPVRMELHQWAEGKWGNDSGSFGIGDSLSFGRDAEIEGVLVGAEKRPSMTERDVNRQGNIVYKSKDAARETFGVLIIGPDGEAEEHILTNDLKEKRLLTAAIKEEEKARQDQEASRTVGGDRTRRPRRSGYSGPSRGEGGLRRNEPPTP